MQQEGGRGLPPAATAIGVSVSPPPGYRRETKTKKDRQSSGLSRAHWLGEARAAARQHVQQGVLGLELIVPQGVRVPRVEVPRHSIGVDLKKGQRREAGHHHAAVE